jgi:outer membrane protein assembly factor BamA
MVLFFSSCSPSRHLASDEYLFVKSKIEVDKRKVEIATLNKYERIIPNKKVLGLRFHLFLYNLANPEKEKFPNNWLKKIGEPPVLLDSVLVLKTRNNIQNYLTDRGYYSVNVESKVKKSRKKARAFYLVDLGEPTRVKSLSYVFEDTSISKYIYADTINSLIRKGGNFDKVLFQRERERIETSLKNKGFYQFSREYVYFEVSTTSNPLLVDVSINIKQNLSGSFDPQTKVRKHKQYKINNVLIVPNRTITEGIRISDTVLYQQHQILYYSKPNIKASTLVSANNLLPGSLYSLNNVERTYNDISALGLFRYVNIDFEEVSDKDEYGELNCKIDLAMRKRQSYAFEVVVTNSSNDLGVRGGITYNNYNFFKGGEHLQIGLTGAIESLEHRLKQKAEPMREAGITSKLETPKFILPFRAESFQRKYKPRTEFQLSYNYQNQPKYIRTIANVSFGYNWRGNVYNRHVFHPIDFYIVKLPWIDSTYIDSIYTGTRLENSFTNHTILGMKYSFEFNNQQLKKGRSFIYLKYNLESTGLLVNFINNNSGWGTDSLFFGVKYFQYIKSDIDFRNYNIISPRDKLVYRFFAGVGVPYGNSESMPFEKMYWSGGPYGIRAWAERTLGPGPYYNSDSYNQLGDVKLEANIEYRFKVIWKMEGALFLDAGNIWRLKEVSEYPGSGFKFNTFYKDIAMGVGFGARFDFSFVLLRTDFGFKLRDPSMSEGSRWTFNNPERDFWQFVFQFGIGYPF